MRRARIQLETGVRKRDTQSIQYRHIAHRRSKRIEHVRFRSTADRIDDLIKAEISFFYPASPVIFSCVQT